jgi:flagellar biosynthetic protein FliQ
MSDALIIALMRYAIETLFYISGPLLAVAIIMGVVISVIQTITSIQDQTFSFAPRLVVIFLVFLFTIPWTLRVLISFTVDLLGDFTPYLH